MTRKRDFLKNSMIVAAHPDDELLWFGSILKDVDRVVIAFEDYWPDPKMGEARRKALAEFPHHNVSSLAIDEAATYGLANWQSPELSEYGILLNKRYKRRVLKQKVKRFLGMSAAPKITIREHYKSNFFRLYNGLKPQLTSDMNVFTHNPWGEYGHEDHIQVFRVLEKLSQEVGFKLWMSNYCTERSLPLAMTYFGNHELNTIQLPVNKRYADKVADVYKRAGCWTWCDEWKWFDHELFIEAPREQKLSQTQSKLIPLNLFNINPVASAAS
jgi:LmbE family N-acetylglucosaminyl deacetylase